MIKIITDSSCDLTKDYIDSHSNLMVLPLKTSYKNENLENMDRKEFYNLLENLDGEFPKTSQYNPDEFYEVFKTIPENQEVLYLGLGSGFSGTYNSAHLAKNMLAEERDVSNIHIYDSQTATCALALLIDLALDLSDRTVAEIIAALDEAQNKIIFSAAVGNLKHLYAGGRLSKNSAAIGNLLNIHPILGALGNKIEVKTKTRGNKKTVDFLINEIKDKNIRKMFIIKGKDSEIFQFFISEINALNIEYTVLEFGPVIATHVGPDCFGVGILTF